MTHLVTPEKMPVALIGLGRVGGLVAEWLREVGYPLVGVSGRPGRPSRSVEAVAVQLGVPVFDSPEEVARHAAVVIIATPDDSIPDVAKRLAYGMQSDDSRVRYVIHTSGALGSDALLPARQAGAAVASMHPLQTFSDPTVVRLLLPKTYFGLEGDPDALEWARSFIGRLGAKVITLSPESKTIYHAAACVASNYLIALLHSADSLMAQSGALPPDSGDGQPDKTERSDPLQLLLPLVEATLLSAQRNGLAAALTGPVARGDVNTVVHHLESLRDRAPYALSVYRSLGSYATHVATEAGLLKQDQAEQLLRLLEKEAPG